MKQQRHVRRVGGLEDNVAGVGLPERVIGLDLRRATWQVFPPTLLEQGLGGKRAALRHIVQPHLLSTDAAWPLLPPW